MTNILLTIVAVLLLVQVIQNGMDSAGPRSAPLAPYRSESGPVDSSPSDRNPSVQENAPLMGHSMFEQALAGFPAGCDKNKTLAVCETPAALAVKAEINGIVEKGAGPRQVFDYIVNKYGVNALTKEAQRIRSMRAK